MILPVKLYLQWRIRRATQKKWKVIFSRLNGEHLSETRKGKFLEFWGDTLASEDIKQLAAFIEISQIDSAQFIPEFQYYFSIEPALNIRAFAAAYSDKNFYERFLRHPKNLFVPTVLRSMNGVICDGDYNPCDLSHASANLLRGVQYIFKPSTATSGGSDVTLIHRSEEDKIVLGGQTFDSLDAAMRSIRIRHGNYIIQERVMQHAWYSKWNPSSLNTIRLMTYRDVTSNEIHHLGSVIRFGRPGSIVDNQAAGGLTCGVDNDGASRSFVCDKFGRVKHEGYFGEMVPYHHEMIEIAKGLAIQFPYHRLLGFDFCVNDKGQVYLLEVNCKNIEINFMQMNNGPIFHHHLPDLMDFVSKNHRQHIFEFYY